MIISGNTMACFLLRHSQARDRQGDPNKHNSLTNKVAHWLCMTC